MRTSGIQMLESDLFNGRALLRNGPLRSYNQNLFKVASVVVLGSRGKERVQDLPEIDLMVTGGVLIHMI